MIRKGLMQTIPILAKTKYIAMCWFLFFSLNTGIKLFAFSDYFKKLDHWSNWYLIDTERRCNNPAPFTPYHHEWGEKGGWELPWKIVVINCYQRHASEDLIKLYILYFFKLQLDAEHTDQTKDTTETRPESLQGVWIEMQEWDR